MTNNLMLFWLNPRHQLRPHDLRFIVMVIVTMASLSIQAASYQLGTSALLEGRAAGTDSVLVAVSPASATWTATANVPWLHLPAGNQSGAGSADVVFVYLANTGPARAGTLTIGGQTLSVTQAGSTYVAASPITTLVSSGLNKPQGVAVDAAGNVYIADTGNNAIEMWTPTNNIVTTLVSSGLNSPASVAVDGAGNLYIADTRNSVVDEWSVAGGSLNGQLSLGSELAESVAVDNAGNVFIGETLSSVLMIGNAVRKWNVAGGTVTTLASNLPEMPEGVAVDVAGNVYFPDNYDAAIKMWAATNNTVISLVPLGLYYFAWSVVVDGSGNVYFADWMNNAIRKWTAASKTVSTLAGSGWNRPQGLAVDAAGNVYVADTGNNTVTELPRAFVDTTTKSEGGSSGSDVLPVVLPSTVNLLPPFAPTSDQPWLTISGVTNGVVSFSFSANTDSSTRTANITLLGQTIPVKQAVFVTAPTLVGVEMAGNLVCSSLLSATLPRARRSAYWPAPTCRCRWRAGLWSACPPTFPRTCFSSPRQSPRVAGNFSSGSDHPKRPR